MDTATLIPPSPAVGGATSKRPYRLRWVVAGTAESQRRGFPFRGQSSRR